MDLSIYIGKRVHIILGNQFTYIGLVISADSDSLTIRDKNNSLVQLKESSIDLIKEAVTNE